MTAPPRDPRKGIFDADWPEDDPPSEEELHLAARLALQLESTELKTHSSDVMSLRLGERESIAEQLHLQATLLKASGAFDLPAGKRRAGQDEVVRLASERARGSPKRLADKSFWRNWFVWAPLPAVALLALAWGLRDAASPESSRAVSRTTTESLPEAAEAPTTYRAFREPIEGQEGAAATSPSEDSPPGGSARLDQPAATARALSAQAALLSARMKGVATQDATEDLDAAMRGYRAGLVASLERTP